MESSRTDCLKLFDKHIFQIKKLDNKNDVQLPIFVPVNFFLGPLSTFYVWIV